MRALRWRVINLHELSEVEDQALFSALGLRVDRHPLITMDRPLRVHGPVALAWAFVPARRRRPDRPSVLVPPRWMARRALKHPAGCRCWLCRVAWGFPMLPVPVVLRYRPEAGAS